MSSESSQSKDQVGDQSPTNRASKPEVSNSASGASPKTPVRQAAVPKLPLSSDGQPGSPGVSRLPRSSSQIPSSAPPLSPASNAPPTLKSPPGQPTRLTAVNSSKQSESSSSVDVRVFITSDMAPNKLCALIVKCGWKMEDFLKAANNKLFASSNTSPRAAVPTGAACSVFWLSNGAEVGALDDLREDDQLILRFQARSISPRIISNENNQNSPLPIEDTDLKKLLPTDGVFRLLAPEFHHMSPLALSEEAVADIIQDECKHTVALNDLPTSSAAETASHQPISLRNLLRRALITTDSTLVDTLIYNYDFFLSHHSFLSIMILHFRAPLAAMDPLSSPRGSVSGPNSARPLPPSSARSASVSSGVLPTYGMSIQMTEPIRRGAAQTKIINVIKRWIDVRYLLIKDDIYSLELLDDFISYLVSSSDRVQSYGETLAAMLKNRRNRHFKLLRNLDLTEQSEIPKEMIKFTKAGQVSPFELACQLTLADQAIYSKIILSELQALRFDHADAATLAPNVHNWKEHNTFITNWVAASILGNPGDMSHGPNKRALLIGHFIAAMDELRIMNSFNAMMQICLGLTHSAISRLDQSWDLVAPKYQVIHNNIMDLVTNTGKGYGSLISTLDPPCIPYLDFHLKELRALEEQNLTVFNNADINLTKLQSITKVVQTLLRHQKAQFNFIPNPGFYSFIKSSEIPSATTMMELSQGLEAGSENSSQNSSGAISGAVSPGNSTSPTLVNGNGSPARNFRASSKSESIVSSLKMKDKKTRKDSVSKKLDKDKDKEKDKEKDKQAKKLEKQAKKIRHLLTPQLSLAQGLENQDIYEQLLTHSTDPSFLNSIQFYKAVIDFKKLFSNDAEPATRRAKEAAIRILNAHIVESADRVPDFTKSSAMESLLKEVEAKAKSDSLWTSNIFDPLLADLTSSLTTSFNNFKTQRSLA